MLPVGLFHDFCYLFLFYVKVTNKIILLSKADKPIYLLVNGVFIFQALFILLTTLKIKFTEFPQVTLFQPFF